MAEELDELTRTPRGWISKALLHTRDELSKLPAVMERYEQRSTEDCQKFVRVGWLSGSDDNLTPLRPFIIVEAPQDEMAAARAAEVTFLVDYQVRVLLCDRAKIGGQNGFVDWCDFVSDVVDGLLARQRCTAGGICRIREIRAAVGRRTDPEMDETEGSHPGAGASEAYWLGRITIMYGPT